MDVASDPYWKLLEENQRPHDVFIRTRGGLPSCRATFPRTKQYLQDKEFENLTLFYPAIEGDQRIPSGLPAGLRMLASKMLLGRT